MTALENRMTEFETRMENQTTGLGKRLAAFEAAMMTRFDDVMKILFALESRLAAMETRLSR
jgi:hypothetical protein